MPLNLLNYFIDLVEFRPISNRPISNKYFKYRNELIFNNSFYLQ